MILNEQRINAVPEVSVNQAKAEISAEKYFAILDVRETFELKLAHLKNDKVINVPISLLAQNGTKELPDELQNKQKKILVICHFGIRSYQVTRWMSQLGWSDVHSMRGGLDDWAVEIDPSIGRY